MNGILKFRLKKKIIVLKKRRDILEEINCDL